MEVENLVTKAMALAIALDIKSGARQLSEFGYAVRAKVEPYLTLKREEVRLQIEVREIAERMKVPAYLAKWAANSHKPKVIGYGGRLGFAPATSECYLEMYKKIPVIRIQKGRKRR